MWVILSKHGCKYCDDADSIARDYQLNYEKRIVDKDTLYNLTGKSTYPQILLNDEHIGGFFEFEERMEPMTRPTRTRFSVFPIKHHNLWSLYKKAQMSNWTAEEVDLSRDMNDWNNLSKNEQHFIKHVLAFFASSDGIVFENINMNFAQEIQYPEARSFYAYQEHNEMVHGETYGQLIEKYITDPIEKDETFRAIETIPCITKKAEWALKWFDRSRPIGERLVAFACVEGIFFSGSFCAIFWLKKRGLLPGLCFSNELISRDEGLHQEFAIELTSMLNNPPAPDVIQTIVSEAVGIEKEFITEALPCKLIGMDSIKMSQYIEFVADRLLKQLGTMPLWESKNPFEFMENISLDGKTNFFEKRVGEYGKMEDLGGTIEFEEDF
jgi:ribonucleoside-diphosphate reductase subunit M2